MSTTLQANALLVTVISVLWITTQHVAFGIITQSNTCNIHSAYYALDTGVCEDCPENCLRCSDSRTCIICSGSYYLNSTNQCTQQQSVPGYFYNDRTFASLRYCRIQNCVKCSQTDFCEICHADFELSANARLCIAKKCDKTLGEVYSIKQQTCLKQCTLLKDEPTNTCIEETDSSSFEFSSFIQFENNYSSSPFTDFFYYSTKFTNEQYIVGVSTYEVIFVRYPAIERQVSFKLELPFSSYQIVSQEIYMVLKGSSSGKLVKCDIEENVILTIVEFPVGYSQSPIDFILGSYFIYPNDTQLVIYDILTKRTETLQLSFNIRFAAYVQSVDAFILFDVSFFEMTVRSRLGTVETKVFDTPNLYPTFEFSKYAGNILVLQDNYERKNSVYTTDDYLKLIEFSYYQHIFLLRFPNRVMLQVEFVSMKEWNTDTFEIQLHGTYLIEKAANVVKAYRILASGALELQGEYENDLKYGTGAVYRFIASGRLLFASSSNSILTSSPLDTSTGLATEPARYPVVSPNYSAISCASEVHIFQRIDSKNIEILVCKGTIHVTHIRQDKSDIFIRYSGWFIGAIFSNDYSRLLIVTTSVKFLIDLHAISVTETASVYGTEVELYILNRGQTSDGDTHFIYASIQCATVEDSSCNRLTIEKYQNLEHVASFTTDNVYVIKVQCQYGKLLIGLSLSFQFYDYSFGYLGQLEVSSQAYSFTFISANRLTYSSFADALLDLDLTTFTSTVLIQFDFEYSFFYSSVYLPALQGYILYGQMFQSHPMYYVSMAAPDSPTVLKLNEARYSLAFAGFLVSSERCVLKIMNLLGKQETTYSLVTVCDQGYVDKILPGNNSTRLVLLQIIEVLGNTLSVVMDVMTLRFISFDVSLISISEWNSEFYAVHAQGIISGKILFTPSYFIAIDNQLSTNTQYSRYHPFFAVDGCIYSFDIDSGRISKVYVFQEEEHAYGSLLYEKENLAVIMKDYWYTTLIDMETNQVIINVPYNRILPMDDTERAFFIGTSRSELKIYNAVLKSILTIDGFSNEPDWALIKRNDASFFMIYIEQTLTIYDEEGNVIISHSLPSEDVYLYQQGIIVIGEEAVRKYDLDPQFALSEPVEYYANVISSDVYIDYENDIIILSLTSGAYVFKLSSFSLICKYQTDSSTIHQILISELMILFLMQYDGMVTINYQDCSYTHVLFDSSGYNIQNDFFSVDGQLGVVLTFFESSNFVRVYDLYTLAVIGTVPKEIVNSSEWGQITRYSNRQQMIYYSNGNSLQGVSLSDFLAKNMRKQQRSKYAVFVEQKDDLLGEYSLFLIQTESRTISKVDFPDFLLVSQKVILDLEGDSNSASYLNRYPKMYRLDDGELLVVSNNTYEVLRVRDFTSLKANLFVACEGIFEMPLSKRVLCATKENKILMLSTSLDTRYEWVEVAVITASFDTAGNTLLPAHSIHSIVEVTPSIQAVYLIDGTAKLFSLVTQSQFTNDISISGQVEFDYFEEHRVLIVSNTLLHALTIYSIETLNGMIGFSVIANISCNQQITHIHYLSSGEATTTTSTTTRILFGCLNHNCYGIRLEGSGTIDIAFQSVIESDVDVVFKLYPPCTANLQVKFEQNNEDNNSKKVSRMYFLCPFTVHVYAVPAFTFINQYTVNYRGSSLIRDIQFLQGDLYAVSGSIDVLIVEMASTFIRVIDQLPGLIEPKVLKIIVTAASTTATGESYDSIWFVGISDFNYFMRTTSTKNTLKNDSRNAKFQFAAIPFGKQYESPKHAIIQNQLSSNLLKKLVYQIQFNADFYLQNIYEFKSGLFTDNSIIDIKPIEEKGSSASVKSSDLLTLSILRDFEWSASIKNIRISNVGLHFIFPENGAISLNPLGKFKVLQLENIRVSPCDYRYSAKGNGVVVFKSFSKVVLSGFLIDQLAENVTFSFIDISEVIIENMNITDSSISLGESTTTTLSFFTFSNVDSISITDLRIDSSAVDIGEFFAFDTVKSLSITNLTLRHNNLKTTSMFKMSNIDSIELDVVSFTGDDSSSSTATTIISNDNTLERRRLDNIQLISQAIQSYLFEIKYSKKIKMSNIKMNNNTVGTGLISCSDSSAMEKKVVAVIDTLVVESLILNVPLLFFEKAVSASIIGFKGDELELFGVDLIRFEAVMAVVMEQINLQKITAIQQSDSSNNSNNITIGLTPIYAIKSLGVPNTQMSTIEFSHFSNVGVAHFDKVIVDSSLNYVNNRVNISDVIVDNVQYSRLRVPIFFVITENLLVREMNVTASMISSTFFSLDIGNEVAVSQLDVRDIVLLNESTMIQVNSTVSASISKSSFSSISSIHYPCALVVKSTNRITVELTRFERLSTYANITSAQVNKDYWGMVNVQSSEELEINSSEFIDCVSDSYSGGLTLQMISKVVISDSLFLRNSAVNYSGGALTIFESTVSINRCLFEGNTAAQERGGAIYISENSKVIIESTHFISNSAIIGGAISYFKDQSSLVLGDSNVFRSNIGVFYGNNIGTSPTNLKRVLGATGNSSEGSSSSNNSYSSSSSSSSIELNAFQSGNYTTEEIYVSFFDEEGDALRFSRVHDGTKQISLAVSTERDAYTLRIEVPTSNKDLIVSSGGNLEYSVDRNAFKLNATMTYQQEMNHSLAIYSNIIRAEKLKINLVVAFRRCRVGEIKYSRYSQIYCEQCEKGSYSLVDPEETSDSSCKSCPSEAISCMGSSIVLSQGYWRDSALSDVIYECENVGCDESAGHQNRCLVGYVGPLCASCDSQGDVWREMYGMSTSNECVLCSEAESTYIKLVFALILYNAYVSYSLYGLVNRRIQQIKLAYLRKMRIIFLNSTCTASVDSGVLMKIILNYVQIFSSAISLTKAIPEELKLSISLGTNPTESTQNSYDCMFLSNEAQDFPLYLSRLCMQSAQMLLSFYLVLSIRKSILNRQVLKASYRVMCMNIIYLFYQPSFSRMLISMIVCRRFGDRWYLLNDSKQECFEGSHLAISLACIYPMAIIWNLVIPWFIVSRMRTVPSKALRQSSSSSSSKKKHFNRIEFIFSYDIFTQGYRKKFYYWEVVRIMMKLVIMITINTQVHIVIKYQIIALVCISYLIASEVLKPIMNRKYARVELILMYCLIVTFIFQSIVNFIGQTDDVFSSRIVILVIVVAINACGITYVLLVYLQKMAKQLSSQEGVMQSIFQTKLVSKFFQMKNVKITRVNQLWKFVYKSIVNPKKPILNIPLALRESKLQQQQQQAALLQKERDKKQQQLPQQFIGSKQSYKKLKKQSTDGNMSLFMHSRNGLMTTIDTVTAQKGGMFSFEQSKMMNSFVNQEKPSYVQLPTMILETNQSMRHQRTNTLQNLEQSVFCQADLVNRDEC